MENKKDIIAFWGCPQKAIINKIKAEYKNITWIDLDIDYGYPDLKIIPDAYCVIIKNILNNAIHLKKRIIKIIAPIGKDKCDSAFFISEILKKEGFEVIQTVFEDRCPDISKLNLPISGSDLSLRQKTELITKNIIEQKDYSFLTPGKERFAFWGVPPNDLSVLDLFPEGTGVYGWLRAVEANHPGDFDLESYVPSGVPTVFFTQSFCSKTALAKYLADKYDGLFIDIDSTPTNSAKAKIEAFLKLR